MSGPIIIVIMLVSALIVAQTLVQAGAAPVRAIALKLVCKLVG